MNVLSLFDGMSCGQLALQDAGFEVDNYFASEIDPYAIKIAKKNFPNTIHLGDVTKIKASDLPPIDLIIGGSPCQGFSIAGEGLGFNDPRSKLYFEYERLLGECNPLYWMLENVKMKKVWVDTITKRLGVTPYLINSNLVSAQNRPRYYWTNIEGVTQPADRGILLRDILQDQVDEKYYLQINANSQLSKRRIDVDGLVEPAILRTERTDFGKQVRSDYEADPKGSDLSWDQMKQMRPRPDGKSNCLSTVLKDNIVVEPGAELPAMLSERRTEEAKQIRRDIRKATGSDHSPRRAKELAPRTDGKANCLTTAITKEHIICLSNYRFRHLTPMECERLQTLPDNYTEGVSDTQRYQMCGNGWTKETVAHLFSYMDENSFI